MSGAGALHKADADENELARSKMGGRERERGVVFGFCAALWNPGAACPLGKVGRVAPEPRAGNPLLPKK